MDVRFRRLGKEAVPPCPDGCGRFLLRVPRPVRVGEGMNRLGLGFRLDMPRFVCAAVQSCGTGRIEDSEGKSHRFGVRTEILGRDREVCLHVRCEERFTVPAGAVVGELRFVSTPPLDITVEGSL